MFFWRREVVSKHKYKSNITCQMWLMLGKKTRVEEGRGVSHLQPERTFLRQLSEKWQIAPEQNIQEGGWVWLVVIVGEHFKEKREPKTL